MINPDEAIAARLDELAEQADSWPWSDLDSDAVGTILAEAIVEEGWRIVRFMSEKGPEVRLIEEWPRARHGSSS